MKKLSICLIFVLCAGLMAACNTNQKKKEKYNRKIYLTEEDYMEDLSQEAGKERRETAPNIESEYIFNVGTRATLTATIIKIRLMQKPPRKNGAVFLRQKKANSLLIL